MNARFSRVALLAVAACCRCLHGETPSTSATAQSLVQRAAGRVATYQTIEAKLRVTTDVMGQPLVGSGAYAQLHATSGVLLRLELTIQAGGKASSVKQICNGPNLWEHWRIGKKEKLNHIDLRRVEQELSRTPPQAGTLTTSLARGGLPKVLVQLEKNFDFNQTAVGASQISKVETWKVRGTWKMMRLQQIAPDSIRTDRIDLQTLPPHIPHTVVIELGRSDLFPYRLAYFRTASGDFDHLQPIVQAEFYEVALNAPLNPSQFDYQQPGNVRVADRTDSFLRSLGVARKRRSPTAR